MIHAKWEPKRGRYYLFSDTLNKDATIKNYQTCWQIQYLGNGARKNLNSYQECIDYLKSKGW
jgi:hypothetical protein